MELGRPSATAEGIAWQRAIHQLIDRPVVFEDSMAARFLGPDKQDELAMVAKERRSPGHLRAVAVARSRFCEDALVAAVAQRSVEQYIILGAGLDTFAYRCPLAASIRVFEVDYPATQDWKRSRLRQAGIAEPPWLTFIPVDLDRCPLLETFVAAGIDTNAPSFFGALGLLNYLSPASVLQTFRAVSTFRSESEIAFEYALPPNLIAAAARGPLEGWIARAAESGEPIRSFLIPSQLQATLLRVGFREVELLGASAINGRYFFGRRDDLRVPAHSALARAIV